MTFDETPDTSSSLPRITGPASLSALWRRLMGRLGFGDRTLWMLLIAHDGQPIHGVQLCQAPITFDDEAADNLMDLVRELAGDGCSVAFLYSRPGPGPRNPDDLSWANGLTRHLIRRGLPVWPVHLANDTELTIVASDDLAATG